MGRGRNDEAQPTMASTAPAAGRQGTTFYPATNTAPAKPDTSPRTSGGPEPVASITHVQGSEAPPTVTYYDESGTPLPAGSPAPTSPTSFRPDKMDFSQPTFQSYTPPAGAGLDMMKPGAAEQRYEDTKGQYDTPSASEQFWSQSSGMFADPTQGEQFAADMNSRYGTGPNISQDANLGAYYDRAKERAVETLDSSLAARGAYGSSVGLGQIGETVSDLEAQRANREADYKLSALAEQRAWADMLSGIQSDAGRQRLERGATGGTLAGMSDQGRMDRLRGGQDAASNAQDHQRQRGQDFFNNQITMGDRMSGLSTDFSNGAITNDQAFLDAIVGLNIGQGAQGTANAAFNGQQSRDDNERLMDNLMNLYAMSQGGKK